MNIQKNKRRIICFMLVVLIVCTMAVPAFAAESNNSLQMEYVYVDGRASIMSALYATGLPYSTGTESDYYEHIKQVLTDSGYEFPVVDGVTDPFPVVYDSVNNKTYIEKAWIEQLVEYIQDKVEYDALTMWDNAILDSAEQKVYLPVTVVIAPNERAQRADSSYDFTEGLCRCTPTSTQTYGTFTPYQTGGVLSNIATSDMLSPVFNDILEILPIAVLAIVGFIAIRKGISFVRDAVQNA